MCGIYFTNIPYRREEVKSKLQSISFRGPDHMEIQQINDFTLGHLRLSILDLDKRSNQPMQYKGLHIVYNGEIYNYLALKEELTELGYTFHTESDTEVLLIGYYHWKEGVLDKINGMFAFSIYDPDNNSSFSARDRLGVKPFYYYLNDEHFEICSQIKPLLENKTINEEAVSIYLDCMFIPSPYTIVNDVYKLPPGCFMIIDHKTNAVQIDQYWDLKKVKQRNISYNKAKEELHELLTDAVKIRLRSDVPIGSFLSGGIDSALVSSIASKISPDKINTFSIGFDHPDYDESALAEQYAEIIKSNHTTTFCNSSDILGLVEKLTAVYDEPFADSSALPSLLLNSVAKKHITVALSGDGGDESFLGYTHFDSLHRNQPIMHIPYFIRKFLSRPFFLNLINQNSHRVRNALNTKTENDFIENIFSRKGFLLKKKRQDWMKHFQDYKHWSKHIIQRAADLNIKLWLENDSNVKVDRASMAYSVEVRSPFLDYRVIEYARTLPVNFRYQKGNQKRILKDILEEYIPRELFNKPKKGFSVPIAYWIRNELKTEFKQALNDEFLKKVPNLNIEKFKRIFQEHLDGQSDHSPNIWKLYVLSKWYEKYGY